VLLFNEFFYSSYYVITESRRFPVSVRSKNYKRMEAGLMNETGFRETAAELWRTFNDDPEAARMDFLANNIRNPHGTWYKLNLRIPGTRTHYRILGFEPNDCKGLIIWDWVGTHEDYNKIWAQKAGSIPNGWYISRGGDVNFNKLEPWLQAACRAAMNAKEKNLPYSQAELDARALRAAKGAKKQMALGRLRRPGVKI
jgi:hypothetical protein